MKNAFIHGVVALTERALPRRTSRAPDPRVLVASTTAMGDTIWATPALAALKETYPASHVALLTSPIGAKILRHDPNLDAVHVVRDRSVLACLRALPALRRARYDAVFLFHVTQRAAIALCRLTGAPLISGFRGDVKGLERLLTHAVDPPSETHAVDKRLQAVAEIGAAPRSPPRLRVTLLDEHREVARRFLASAGIDTRDRVVAIQPGANHATRRWPADRFAATCAALAAQDGLRVVVTGSPAEQALVERVVGGSRAVGLTDQLDLLGAAAVLARADLVITNDTGPMHVASAFDRPIVCLFGESSLASRPYNHAPAILLRPRPGAVTRDDPRGLRGIEVEDVLRPAEALLSAPAPRE